MVFAFFISGHISLKKNKFHCMLNLRFTISLIERQFDYNDVFLCSYQILIKKTTNFLFPFLCINLVIFYIWPYFYFKEWIYVHKMHTVFYTRIHDKSFTKENKDYLFFALLYFGHFFEDSKVFILRVFKNDQRIEGLFATDLTIYL